MSIAHRSAELELPELGLLEQHLMFIKPLLREQPTHQVRDSQCLPTRPLAAQQCTKVELDQDQESTKVELGQDQESISLELQVLQDPTSKELTRALPTSLIKEDTITEAELVLLGPLEPLESQESLEPLESQEQPALPGPLEQLGKEVESVEISSTVQVRAIATPRNDNIH